MYRLTFLTSSTLSLPTSPLPLRLVLHHHLLVPGAVPNEVKDEDGFVSPRIDPKTTPLSQLLKTIDIYRNEGRPLKVRVEMLLGGKVVSCGEVGGAAHRVRDWFLENQNSLGLTSVSELFTDGDDGTSFTLHPSRSSIAPNNPSSRPSGRLIAFDVKLHWGRKINKKLLKKNKTTETTVAGVVQEQHSGSTHNENAGRNEVSEKAQQRAKDDVDEYFSVYGKSLRGPNMSTGALAVLDKAMLQLVRFKLGRNYPFVFNEAYLEKLDLQLPHLDSIVGSLSDIILRSTKSTRQAAKKSYIDVQTSNLALVRSTRSNFRRLAAGKKTNDESSSETERDEDDSGRPLPDEDVEPNDSDDEDGPTVFKASIKEGLARVYLNQIKPGYLKVETPSKPDHPRALPFAPIVPLLPEPVVDQPRPKAVEPLDDNWDFDMASPTSIRFLGEDQGPAAPDCSAVLAQNPSKQFGSPQVTSASLFSGSVSSAPSPESDKELATTSPKLEKAPEGKPVPPELIQWDMDDDWASQGSALSGVVEGRVAEGPVESAGGEGSAQSGGGGQRATAVGEVQSSAHAEEKLEGERVKAVETNWEALYDD